MTPIEVGSCGWDQFESLFPADASPEERLAAYAQTFRTVEVGGAFAPLPTAESAARWVDCTPSDFTFYVKVPVSLTGFGGIPDSWTERAGSRAREESHRLDEVARGALPLHEAGKLAALLVVFPPWFRFGADEFKRITQLTEALSPLPVAVEFRHRSWFFKDRAEETLAFLRAHGLIHTISDQPQIGGSTVPAIFRATQQTAVCRCYGKDARVWQRVNRQDDEGMPYVYTRHQLREWFSSVRSMAERASLARVDVLFHNGAETPQNTAKALEVSHAGMSERRARP